jgi:hypothetical protein
MTLLAFIFDAIKSSELRIEQICQTFGRMALFKSLPPLRLWLGIESLSCLTDLIHVACLINLNRRELFVNLIYLVFWIDK